MKRLVMCLAIVCAIALIFTVADLKAATSQNIWITVSISGTNSIVVTNPATNGSTNWNILNVPFNFTTNRQVSTVISNDGLITETLGLQLENLFVNWTNSIDVFNNIDVYVLQGIYKTNASSRPAPLDYSSDNGTDDDVITVTPQDSDTFKFGSDAINNGVGVLPGGKRELWLKMQVPTGGNPNNPPVSPTVRCIISSTAI